MNTTQMSAHLTSARASLETTVADDREFAPMIVVMRGGLMIAQVLPQGGAGGMIQRVAQLCAEGFGADEILLVMDSYLVTGDGISPLTGQEWGTGEMEFAVQHHDALAKGWVTECLTVLAVPREGAFAGWSLPYFREADRSVTWGDPSDIAEGEGRLTRLYESTPLGGRQLPDREMAAVLAGLGAVVMLAEYEDNRS